MGWDPADCTVYAYGGNGPLFVTAVADRLGAPRARFSRFGNVYSAYGSAISDVVHLYESAVDGAGQLEVVGAELAGQARRDLRGEGFDADSAALEWELRSASAVARGPGDGPGALDVGGAPTLVRLTACYPLPRLEAPAAQAAAAAAPTGSRGSPPLPAYSAASLPGSELPGPLLADGGTYTWLVTDGWVLSTDAHGDASLVKASS